MRLERRTDDMTLADLVERWGHALKWANKADEIRDWIYRLKILKPLKSSLNSGRRGLRFSKAEIRRFETAWKIGPRKPPSAGAVAAGGAA